MRRLASRMGWPDRVVGLAVCWLLGSSAAVAQGALSGRVTILEKPGESTTDLKNAVVYLVAKSGSPRMSEGKSKIEMDGRAFTPHVIVVTPGSTVQFPNADPFSHNIFSTAAGAAFDLGVYGSGPGKSTTFKKVGAFPVYCNIHPKMTAYVLVVNTPWHTQPGQDGRWTLGGVPSGKYEMHVWHERAAEYIREIEVTATTAALDAQLDARGFKLADHKNKFGQDYTAAGVRY
jgi:plastocyanin